MATITVDGKEIQAKENALLIEELLANDINIPHFCYHPALGKDGNCRMCMVEIEGKKRPQIACDTPVKNGMVIRTKSENIERVKRSILELELINHPIDCPICDQAGECSLQNYYMDVGLYESRLQTPKTHAKKHVDIGANVVLDQERCVLCTRCVRFTKNITKTNELGVLNRSDHSVITTFPNHPLSNPYAMNVVDLCPVGALTSKDFRFNKRVWFLEPDNGICNGCARGCNIFVDHHQAKYEEDIIFRYRPRFNALVNGYFICDYGRLSYKKENESLSSKPLIRGKESEYEYSMMKILRLLKHHYGNTSFVISASLSLEQMYALKKMAYRYDANLYAYNENYDENFGDDFLKVNDKETNRKSIKLLGINESKEDLYEGIKKSELLVFIGRCDILLEEEKTVVCISPYPPSEREVDVYLPILSHTHVSGTYINCEGIVQFHTSKIKNSGDIKSLLELISFYTEINHSTCKEIWEEGLGELMGEITLGKLKLESIKLGFA
ncbi:MAG TPA: NADH-quinone oxidoreductase subunit G [Sulfurospirillum sp. UBA12182]|nr:MAG TPA: NADH-quinone oxidoreductase subunit G [Sulfurospirillum sp. UBA12182]